MAVQTQRIINPDAFQKAFEAVNEGKVGYVNSDAFEMWQFETDPIEGYIPPENFPDCCEFHRNVLKSGQDIYERFPDCCEGHKYISTKRDS